MSDLGDITLSWTITFRRRSKHSAERLWRAITDPEEMSKWMTYPARIDLRVGGDFFVDFSRTSDSNLDGVIVRVEHERNLAYVWGRSLIEWTIEPDGDGCRYTFVSHGQDSPSEGDRWTNEGIAAGWHGGLDALDAHLDGASIAEALTAHEQLETPYRERLEAVLAGVQTPS